MGTNDGASKSISPGPVGVLVLWWAPEHALMPLPESFMVQASDSRPAGQRSATHSLSSLGGCCLWRHEAVGSLAKWIHGSHLVLTV